MSEQSIQRQPTLKWQSISTIDRHKSRNEIYFGHFFSMQNFLVKFVNRKLARKLIIFGAKCTYGAPLRQRPKNATGSTKEKSNHFILSPNVCISLDLISIFVFRHFHFLDFIVMHPTAKIKKLKIRKN